MATQTETPREWTREASREAAATRAAEGILPRVAPGRYVQRPHELRRALERCRGGAPWAVADRLSALCHGLDGHAWYAHGVPVVLVQWARDLGYHHTTIGRALRALEAAGVVERVGDRWRCVAAPVVHAAQGAQNDIQANTRKNVDSTDMCASTQTPVIYNTTEYRNTIRSETETTIDKEQTQQQENSPEIADNIASDTDRYRHRAACRWYVFLSRPVAGLKRRYSLPEVAAVVADELSPGWYQGRYAASLADAVAARISDNPAYCRNVRGWSAAAVTWALRCAAEDRADGTMPPPARPAAPAAEKPEAVQRDARDIVPVRRWIPIDCWLRYSKVSRTVDASGIVRMRVVLPLGWMVRRSELRRIAPSCAPSAPSCAPSCAPSAPSCAPSCAPSAPSCAPSAPSYAPSAPSCAPSAPRRDPFVVSLVDALTRQRKT